MRTNREIQGWCSCYKSVHVDSELSTSGIIIQIHHHWRLETRLRHGNNSGLRSHSRNSFAYLHAITFMFPSWSRMGRMRTWSAGLLKNNGFQENLEMWRPLYQPRRRLSLTGGKQKLSIPKKKSIHNFIKYQRAASCQHRAERWDRWCLKSPILPIPSEPRDGIQRGSV